MELSGTKEKYFDAAIDLFSEYGYTELQYVELRYRLVLKKALFMLTLLTKRISSTIS